MVARYIAANEPFSFVPFYPYPVGTCIVLKEVRAVGQEIAVGLPGIKTDHPFDELAAIFAAFDGFAEGARPVKHAAIRKAGITHITARCGFGMRLKSDIRPFGLVFIGNAQNDTKGCISCVPAASVKAHHPTFIAGSLGHIPPLQWNTLDIDHSFVFGKGNIELRPDIQGAVSIAGMVFEGGFAPKLIVDFAISEDGYPERIWPHIARADANVSGAVIACRCWIIMQGIPPVELLTMGQLKTKQ